MIGRFGAEHRPLSGWHGLTVLESIGVPPRAEETKELSVAYVEGQRFEVVVDEPIQRFYQPNLSLGHTPPCKCSRAKCKAIEKGRARLGRCSLRADPYSPCETNLSSTGIPESLFGLGDGP